MINHIRNNPIHNSVTLHKCIKIGFGVVIDENVSIGRNVFIGHNTVIRSDVVISDNVVIGHNVVIEADAFIGEGTTIQSQCHITKNIYIGEKVFMGPMVTTMNEKNIAKDGRAEQKLEGPIIKRGARIGTRTIILPGVVINENAMTAVGSLINKDIPEKEFWAGSPARRVKSIPDEECV